MTDHVWVQIEQAVQAAFVDRAVQEEPPRSQQDLDGLAECVADHVAAAIPWPVYRAFRKSLKRRGETLAQEDDRAARTPYILGSESTVREGSTVSPAEASDLLPQPTDLSFIRIAHQTRLQFGNVEVVIENAFRLRSNNDEILLNPRDRAGLGPLLAQYPSELVSSQIGPDCALTLTLSNDCTITVSADEHYEAWQIVGPGARLIVCPPGGASLDVWT